MAELTFNNCIPNCPLCFGVGWTNHHEPDCTCADCDMSNPKGDIRRSMGPCPNQTRLIVDVTSPLEVAYARKHGFIVEA